MMKVDICTVGLYEVNCVLLTDGGKAWVVDPGQDAAKIVAALRKLAAGPAGILLTHAHFDHIGGIAGLQQVWPALPVYVHPNDSPAFTHPMNQMPPDYPPLDAAPKNICDCRTLTCCQVIETPGHTPGGVSYYFAAEKILLSGDTLFAGSVGRTDFPGGNFAALRRSLECLAALPDETRVIPGHGAETTIGCEKRSNPFLT